MSETIFFYEPEGEYGYLANFSLHPIVLDDREWPTVEHYFQAAKFSHRPDLSEAIRVCPTPREAKNLAAALKLYRSAEWWTVRDEVMYRAIRAKFQQHSALRGQLALTGNAQLIEASPTDLYWGQGLDGTGSNKAGKILMRIRSELRTCLKT
jgi:ribA/ribD-fused uncharacterized protein